MDIEIKLSQSQMLSPQMELSVRILQMDNARLNEYLKEVMLENPVIEVEQPLEKDHKQELALRKLEWLESQTVREKENVGYYDEDNDLTIEKTAGAADQESLVDHLLVQVSLNAPAALLPVARYVVGCIDENGYLAASRTEMYAESGFAEEEIARGIALVQTFDPAGVGARNLRECLLLQLPAQDSVARRLVDGFLEEVAKNRQGYLAKQLGIDVETVAAAVERIRRLNPKPGALYGLPPTPGYITPDVVVTNFEDRYNVMLCEFSYPEIRLSETYLRMARESADKEVVDYIGNKANQVNWIKKCIENRNKTLLAVAKAIVKKQERFFRYGPQHLNILRMRDIADIIDMHESTVSRAVRDKYLQCSHGIYPLRHFFVKGMEGAAGDTSSHNIKWKIRRMIETENKASPLSDQKITDLLCTQGMPISRRTVAKYREEMEIPKSSERIGR